MKTRRPLLVPAMKLLRCILQEQTKGWALGIQWKEGKQGGGGGKGVQEWCLASVFLHTVGLVFGVETPMRDKVGTSRLAFIMALPPACCCRETGSHSSSAKLPVTQTLQESEVTPWRMAESIAHFTSKAVWFSWGENAYQLFIFNLTASS